MRVCPLLFRGLLGLTWTQTGNNRGKSILLIAFFFVNLFFFLQYNCFSPFLPLFPLQKTPTVDFSWNKLADPKFVFHDHKLVETVRDGNLEAQAFFRLLALCHTVMPEEKKEGKCPLCHLKHLKTPGGDTALK